MTSLPHALAALAVGMSICAATGCGAPAAKAAPTRAVPLSRFDARRADAARAPATPAAGWVGEYEGRAAVRRAGVDGPAASQSIRVLIQATAPDRLTVLQLPAGHPDSFSLFDVEVDESGRAVGRRLAADGDLRWEYALSRAGTALTGTIELYRKNEMGDQFEPGSAWTLTVTRVAGP